jgi:hypothetical protein
MKTASLTGLARPMARGMIVERMGEAEDEAGFMAEEDDLAPKGTVAIGDSKATSCPVVARNVVLYLTIYKKNRSYLIVCTSL